MLYAGESRLATSRGAGQKQDFHASAFAEQRCPNYVDLMQSCRLLLENHGQPA